jgi:hypothetical protein
MKWAATIAPGMIVTMTIFALKHLLGTMKITILKPIDLLLPLLVVPVL